MNRPVVIVGLSLLLAVSCRTPNTEAEILSFSILGSNARVIFQDPGSELRIEFPEQLKEAGDLVAVYELSPGASAQVSGIPQISGETMNDFEKPFYYLITAEDEIQQKSWKIVPVNNDYTSGWGLGGFQKQPLSNNRDYEWYIDQANTGTHSGNNCGPSTTVMASLWSDPEYTSTPVDARDTYRSEGGWWYTTDIRNYLDDFGIPNHTVELGSSQTSTAQILKQELDGGSVAILCLDMFFVPYQSNSEYRTDKFYTTASKDWGHFILVKGYREVDGRLYWEVYDSNSYGKTYTDGSLKGKDRYYNSKGIHDACEVWWNYAIIVSRKGTKSTPVQVFDHSSIPDARGR